MRLSLFFSLSSDLENDTCDECTMDERGKGSIRLGTITKDINDLLVTENQTKPGLEDIGRPNL
ncbi:MAG TPA: hypothetical protein DCR17_07905, partial [Verrucomicrobiales bacterium]|nr:hypothetical protein [Verrucomicrobiales bacterium]